MWLHIRELQGCFQAWVYRRTNGMTATKGLGDQSTYVQGATIFCNGMKNQGCKTNIRYVSRQVQLWILREWEQLPDAAECGVPGSAWWLVSPDHSRLLQGGRWVNDKKWKESEYNLCSWTFTLTTLLPIYSLIYILRDVAICGNNFDTYSICLTIPMM